MKEQEAHQTQSQPVKIKTNNFTLILMNTIDYHTRARSHAQHQCGSQAHDYTSWRQECFAPCGLKDHLEINVQPRVAQNAGGERGPPLPCAFQYAKDMLAGKVGSRKLTAGASSNRHVHNIWLLASSLILLFTLASTRSKFTSLFWRGS